MATTRVPGLYGLAAVLVLFGLTGLARAADGDAELREKALALNTFTGSDVLEGQIKILLEDGPGTKKLLAAAAVMAKEKDQPFNYNGAFILARTAQELKQFEACETFYRICIDGATKLRSGQKLLASFGGLIDYYYENKKFERATKLCREFLEKSEGDFKDDLTVQRLKPFVMERMIQAMARQGKFEEALKLVDNLVKLEEEDKGWWALSVKGGVLREANRSEEAAKTYETVLERLGADKALKKEVKQRYIERNRYLLSGVYVDLNKIDKAAEHLQALLKDKPDDPTYNNDLGYIWADHDMNLEESEKLIRKAIEMDRKQRKADPELSKEDDKDNAAYLDSLGWVLYKRKKYEEAKKHLVEAVKDKDGQHIEIFDHLGDVYKALGDKANAVDAWKKGVDAAGTSKREQDRKTIVEKKIKENE